MCSAGCHASSRNAEKLRAISWQYWHAHCHIPYVRLLLPHAALSVEAQQQSVAHSQHKKALSLMGCMGRVAAGGPCPLSSSQQGTPTALGLLARPCGSVTAPPTPSSGVQCRKVVTRDMLTLLLRLGAYGWLCRVLRGLLPFEHFSHV
jgi:hypothetical protein